VARTTYTLAEYQAAAAALAPKGGDVPHVCVRCGTVQSARSFARAGIKSEVYESVIGYSCIGRFVDGVGCDWTCGGLLGDLSRGVEITTPNGKVHTRFPFGTAEESARLSAAGGAPFVRAGAGDAAQEGA
jgi:hypothetical protein